MSADIPLNINIKEPRWDQSTFAGRANHFFTVTDPRNILLSDAQLENARKIVHDYRCGTDRFHCWPKIPMSMTRLYIKGNIKKNLYSLHRSFFVFQSLNDLFFL